MRPITAEQIEFLTLLFEADGYSVAAIKEEMGKYTLVDEPICVV